VLLQALLIPALFLLLQRFAALSVVSPHSVASSIATQLATASLQSALHGFFWVRALASGGAVDARASVATNIAAIIRIWPPDARSSASIFRTGATLPEMQSSSTLLSSPWIGIVLGLSSEVRYESSREDIPRTKRRPGPHVRGGAVSIDAAASNSSWSVASYRCAPLSRAPR